jgi:hypothetical protein
VDEVEKERWNSPEVIEQLKQELMPGRTQPLTAELVLIRDLVLMPHLLTMCDREMQERLKYMDSTFKPLYESVMQLLMDQISADMREVKQTLAKRNIRLSGNPIFNETYYSFPYICRGYEAIFYLVRDVMAMQVRLMLTEYLSKVYRDTAGKLEG